jgi:hypothetical protein
LFPVLGRETEIPSTTGLMSSSTAAAGSAMKLPVGSNRMGSNRMGSNRRRKLGVGKIFVNEKF